jgi:hypothetical protein
MARPTRNKDYVEHGSERHAALLGLRKAESDDELSRDGWTLSDITNYPPETTEIWLKRLLRSLVNELASEPPKYQSSDPGAPFYAPELGEV